MSDSVHTLTKCTAGAKRSKAKKARLYKAGAIVLQDRCRNSPGALKYPVNELSASNIDNVYSIGSTEMIIRGSGGNLLALT